MNKKERAEIDQMPIVRRTAHLMKMDTEPFGKQAESPFQVSPTRGLSPIDAALDDALRKIGVKAAAELAYMPKKVSRNDPCPCGSGKKFKRCHEGRTANNPR